MKEKLYTIPLMDAFKAEDECPFCFVERQLEQHAMDFVLGAGHLIWKTMYGQKLIKWAFAVHTIRKCMTMETVWVQG